MKPDINAVSLIHCCFPREIATKLPENADLAVGDQLGPTLLCRRRSIEIPLYDFIF